MASNKFHDAITEGDALKAYVVNTPLQQLDKILTDMDDGTHAFSNINVDGGTIDGTTIGATVPAPGTFTTISVTGDLSLGSCLMVYSNVAQTVATVTTDQVTFDEVLLDNNSDFDLDTYYWTPSVAGWYMLVAQCEFTALAASKQFKTIITKNGAVAMTGHRVSESLSNILGIPYTTIQQANGSSDYFGVQFYNGDTGSISLSFARFFGFRIF